MAPIDARIEATRLRELYTSSKETISVLLTGESGSGKTYLAKSAPFPVHIDSFDPGGTLSVRDEIKKGNIIVDTKFENEDPYDPKVFREWERTFTERVNGGYFEHFSCYWLDSATWWVDSILGGILKKAGRAGSAPLWEKDWYPQKIILTNYIRKCQNLPCHFILTAHLMPQKDRDGNVIAWRPNFSGQAAIAVPTMFDEVWIMEREIKSGGGEYSILTQAAGRLNARSRLSMNGKLKVEEEPNLRNILKKAGVNYEDKPTLLEKE